MQKWEYLRLEIHEDYPENELNIHGEQGWELVTITFEGTYYVAFLKRLKS